MSTQAEMQEGTLFVVATPIGNRDDLTRRAERVLCEVDFVLCEDTRHSARLLNDIGSKAPRISLHEHNERNRLASVIERLRLGESGALISDAGTPLINDPGFVLVRALRQAGLRVVPVPGPSALIAALSAAGLPTDRFAFEGFLPAKAGARRERLQSLAGDTRALVFYEAPHRLVDLLTDARAVLGPERRGCVAREITKLFEEFRDGTVSELLGWAKADANAARGELVVMFEGAAQAAPATALDADTLLRALLEELPASKAAKVAARLLSEKRQVLYQRALELSGDRGNLA